MSADKLTEPVDTKYGKIVGRRIIDDAKRPVNAFQGVPFAKPPLGELRFKRPQKPDSWRDILKTTHFKARPIADDRHPELNVPIAEDCLYLNVFSPAWPTAGDSTLFPVMVFVHGGGFFFDSAAKYGDIGISTYLVGQCKTVVVTVEYRLGFLGFFTTGNDACDDNVALWDMTMALEWVHENIRRFHGDPDNITLFGQSAGGASVDFLSLSPKSSGLFHRVIPMSGNASCSWSINPEAVECCRKFASQRGVMTAGGSKQMIKSLRALDPMKFVVSFDDILQKSGAVVCPIAPRLDGDFLPDTVERMRQTAPKMPRIIGLTEYEGLLFWNENFSLSDLESDIASQIPEREFSNFVELRQKALDLYIKSTDYNNVDSVRTALIKFRSDTFIGIGAQKAVLEHLRASKEQVYLYSFDYCNPEAYGDMPRKVNLATHCIDLNYLLYIYMFGKYDFNESDWRVLRIITKLWSNFAKCGDPNGLTPDSRPEGDFEWLPATAEHPSRYLSIGPNPKMHEHFQEGRPMFWAKIDEQCKKDKFCLAAQIVKNRHF